LVNSLEHQNSGEFGYTAIQAQTKRRPAEELSGPPVLR
jgi:hypothetical protein